MRPWVLAETNYAAVLADPPQVAVLPLGATEPHNLHLPYATDTLEADVIGERICREAWRRGARTMLLPTIPYGTETNQRQCPLSLNVNPSTLGQVIFDLVDSLVRHGVEKILLLNSHGGNDLKGVVRELYGRSPAKVFLCDWFRMIADVAREVCEHRDDHAGEMETSLALAFFPHLVARQPDGSLAADEGAAAASRFEAVNRGWVSLTRPWHLLTTNTGSGDPRQASAEKGERLMEAIVERLAGFLVELAASPLDERFPF